QGQEMVGQEGTAAQEQHYQRQHAEAAQGTQPAEAADKCAEFSAQAGRQGSYSRHGKSPQNVLSYPGRSNQAGPSWVGSMAFACPERSRCLPRAEHLIVNVRQGLEQASCRICF